MQFVGERQNNVTLLKTVFIYVPTVKSYVSLQNIKRATSSYVISTLVTNSFLVQTMQEILLNHEVGFTLMVGEALPPIYEALRSGLARPDDTGVVFPVRSGGTSPGGAEKQCRFQFALFALVLIALTPYCPRGRPSKLLRAQSLLLRSHTRNVVGRARSNY